ncbi:MAG: hypothetical protein HY308_03100 [Gammaproteobacteria bacterium]|nr:hypothetical protein [Gammaproteobacteria bacterium]
MEPISLLVSALAAGAAAGLKPTAEQVVKDGYVALKSLIKRKWSKVPVDLLEDDPACESRQAVVRGDLTKANAVADQEALTAAQALLENIRKYAPDDALRVGVRLEDFRAGGHLLIRDVEAEAAGVDIKKAVIDGNVEISGVRQGGARIAKNPQ